MQQKDFGSFLDVQFLCVPFSEVSGNNANICEWYELPHLRSISMGAAIERDLDIRITRPFDGLQACIPVAAVHVKELGGLDDGSRDR